MPDNSPRILVGRFGAAHGVRGEIRIKSFTADPMALASYAGLTDQTGARSFRIESARPVKDDLIVARVAGLKDRNGAEALTNVEIYIAREALPPAGEEEFYIADLIGMRAELADGAAFGTITNVLNFGAGDILDIALEGGGSRLLPFTRACAPHVDVSGRRVIVAPPDEIEGEEAPGDAPRP
ncbi:MAG: ribosome maturation factor RimM [Beijerinckiaceae bacterium]|nr:ribosome maturation factor RimM [Beijerinckiaceae bacterium]